MVQVQQRILRAGPLLLLWTQALAAQHFYPDDPLVREPRPMAVPKALARSINEYYDFFENTLFERVKEEKKQHSPGRSQAVNTLGEVPDSAWFTNRIGTRRMSIEELVRGPGVSSAPATGRPWTVVSGKNEGVTPGVVIRDSEGRRYFLKFDPKSNPEMATAADVLGCKFFYDLGYNVPQNYIVRFDRRQLTVDEKSKLRMSDGRERQMTDRDVDAVLAKASRPKDGFYRGMASLAVEGDAIGPFRYYGTRKDDPNDVVEHQNRRDLRGLYVFAAWLNHTDTKSINSLDSVVEEDGVKYIRHHLIDFGAILGSDSFEAKSPRAGNVYLFDFKPAAWQFLSLGFYVPTWMRVHYPDIPGAGRLDYENFDPRHWKNNYPNPAFDLRTPGDTWWAAKKVMAFSNADIRAIVESGQFSDPHAVEWITKCLIERRDRIGKAFFDDVLPLDDFAVENGRLAYEDLAVTHAFREPRGYTVTWSEFDNVSGRQLAIPGASGWRIPRTGSEYLAAEIRGEEPGKGVTVYLRGERVLGVERTP
jgi:hypothetical protein